MPIFPQKTLLCFPVFLVLFMAPAMSTADRGIVHAGPSSLQAQQGAEEFSEAILWYSNRAEQGHTDAQFYLGLMYALGKGLPRDYQKAAMWYRKAADQGYADAQFELGRLYAVGDGVPQDMVQAYIWIFLAADQGHGKALSIRELIGLQLSPAQMEEARKSLLQLLPKKQQ